MLKVTGASASLSAAADTSPELIVINHDLGFSKYCGTRAQLEAEGIIPEGTKWPTGYDDLRWRSRQFDFWLRRRRPEGAKGPRKQFLDYDWWFLRWELINAPSFNERHISRLRAELAAAIYRQSARGQAEGNANWNRHWEAHSDAAFQSFLGWFPGLVRPVRAAKAKVQGGDHA